VFRGLKKAENIAVVPARILSVFVLQNVLLDAKNIIGCRDEREQSNNNGSDANSLEQLSTATRMTRNRARDAECAYQCHRPEQSPGQVEDRVERQLYKSNT